PIFPEPMMATLILDIYEGFKVEVLSTRYCTARKYESVIPVDEL
ncbi:MAG: hypothetical protein ACI9EA_000645, partial [Pseudomonadales bacterium]